LHHSLAALQEKGISGSFKPNLRQVSLTLTSKGYSTYSIATSKSLDKKYLDHWKPDELWTTLVFPQEKPPTSIFIFGDRCFTLLPLKDGFKIRLGALSPKATRSGSGNTTKTP
jgi:hypothetical protein